MSGTDILDLELEEQRSRLDRLIQEFRRGLPKPFAHAAAELEFEKIVEFHLNLSPGELGQKALVKELQPSTDTDRIDQSLREIAEMRTMLTSNDRPPFMGLSDIRPTLRKVEIEGSTLYVEEGIRVLRLLRGMRALREFFGKRAKDAPLLWKSGVHLYDDRLLEMHFMSVFDDAGNVKDNASSELARIRREILQTAEHLRAKLSSILRRLTEDSFVQEELITQRDGRYVVPVKVEHKRRLPGFIHSVSQTGQTVFIEPTETLDLNNELRSLEFAEQREIDRIMTELAKQLRQAIPELMRAIDATAHLEAILAKARYANEVGANAAISNQQIAGRQRKLKLTGARHPLLFKKLGRVMTVPLSLELDDLNHTLVLTGPNAGGKTVLLKTIGLAILMAQSGIPILGDPDAELPLIDALFVEIGDSQSLADDLSTFSSHVSALSNILGRATSKSMILLDEIGGGTAPEDGGALAESILEYLTKLGAFTLATTHFGRLAAYAEAERGAINGSMEFSAETLTPTFRFRLGVPGSSHAFEIAERYGLSKSLLRRAAELRGIGSTRLEDLIRSLEELQEEAREKKRESERELGKARVARVDYERKRDEIEDIRRTARNKASAEAEEILKRANSFVERAVREVKEVAKKESSGASQASAQAEKELRHLRAQQESERKSILAALEAQKSPVHTENSERAIPKLGSIVQLRSNPGQHGEVVSVEGNNAEVLLGGLRVRAKLDQLELVDQKSGTKQNLSKNGVSQATKFLAEAPETRIDLRGEYAADAIPKVERFLSDAAAHSLDRVDIIHGMGTGALGRKIGEYLKGHPLVSSYRYGQPAEGGAGVTIVELK
jgi:DNA mismatch repair protein MutS2